MQHDLVESSKGQTSVYSGLVVRLMSTAASPEPDAESRRLDILISDYEMAREDERSFTNVMAALTSAAVGILAAAVVLLQQTCILNGNRGQCWEMSQTLLAAVPLVPLACLALLQALGQVSVVRSYYLRALEQDLQKYAVRPLEALGNIYPASYSGIVNEITSLRRGRKEFRLLVGLVLMAVLVVFGGLATFIAVKLTETLPQVLMAAIYIPLTLLITIELANIWLNGRGLFRKLCESYVSSRLGQPLPVANGVPGPPPSRSIGSYLLAPRPDEWLKGLISPVILAVFAVFADSPINVAGFLVLWSCYELLIYPARYQWNDIRGYADDIAHPERAHKRRLPILASKAEQKRLVAVSSAVIAIRVASAVAVGVVANQAESMLWLVGATVAASVLYEALKDARPLPRRLRALLLWVAVSFGYAIRAAISVFALGIAIVGLYGQVVIWSVAALGVTIVLLIWTLDASSHCDGDLHGPHWRAQAEFRDSRPQVAELLMYTARPPLFLNAYSPTGSDGATQPVLRDRGALAAPWNLFGVVAVLASTWAGVWMPGRPPLAQSIELLGLASVLLLFFALAACSGTKSRLLVFSVMLAGAAAACIYDIESMRISLPLIALSVAYIWLRHTTYREFMLGPKKIVAACKLLAKAAGRVWIGRKTSRLLS